MQTFVDIMLQRLPGVQSNAEVELLLGHIAEHLGYRSAYLLDFPNDETLPIRLWDSNAERSAWWHELTANGLRSISRSLAEILAHGGVQHMEVPADDPRHALAVAYDFNSATVVPITFDTETRGVVSFSGDATDLADVAPSLQVVCYALLMQARLIGSETARAGISLTPRERQVVELSAKGLTSEAIASGLGMSPRTVNQHLDNTSSKLGTRNRVHTVAEAIRRGLLG